jgi:Fe(3+) dicitrate transport protein
VISLFFAFAFAQAEPSSLPSALPVDSEAPRQVSLDAVSVSAKSLGQARLAGSANEVDAKKIENFGYTDVHRTLSEVPGVYVRDEDGVGLRPNIGLRGASSDRSAKVTLMEDGVLFGPAPYSAPAAYYFPLMTRIVGVEVYKGPASIKYGPNTIGGALNLVTRAVPRKLALMLDVGGGMYGNAKAAGHLGWGNERFGILLEGGYVRSDGFKHLPSKDPTGFDRNEFMMKASYNTPIDASVVHQFDAKVGYSGEISKETYVGISDADFTRDPYQRYAASNFDTMRAWRTQAVLGYSLFAGEMWEFNVKAYRNDQVRAWKKVNSVQGAPPLEEVFRADREGTSPIISALAGRSNSSALEPILIGTSNRRFVSQGVQSALVAHPVSGPVKQDIELGLRFHYDSIIRVHDEGPYDMVSGLPLLAGPIGLTANNDAWAAAFAAHVQDSIAWKRLLITPGLRFEYVKTRLTDRITGTLQFRDNQTVALLPGIGAYLGFTDWVGVLAGVHRGFSPKAPGTFDTASPELSWNYEAGARVGWKNGRTKLDAEAIGFFNDYQNLTVTCTESNGCAANNVGQQFSGRNVYVYGAEAGLSLKHAFSAQGDPRGVELRSSASYTLTLSSFRSDIVSDNPIWGEIRKGDRLPYVPEHQGSLSVGISMKKWGVDVAFRAQSLMRDVAGQGAIDVTERIPAFAYLDAAAYYVLPMNIRLYVTVDNLTNATSIVSRRPFGIRPGKPITAMAGLRYQF